MVRKLVAAAAQMGPVARIDNWTHTVASLIDMLREVRGRECRLVVFPELALTTFFPRWMIEDKIELDSYCETQMPGAATQPLFDEAARLGIGFDLGYAELVRENGVKQRYNASILVDQAGRIIGKYRKVHLPGHADPQAGRAFQHLEKLFFSRAISAFLSLTGLAAPWGCVSAMTDAGPKPTVS